MVASANTSYNPTSPSTGEFISHKEILETPHYTEENKRSEELIDRIPERTRPKYEGGRVRCEGPTYREASVLLACDFPEESAETMKLAGEIELAFHESRVVFFVPFYLPNYCMNGCTYYPYHMGDKHIKRRKLTQEEVWQEVIVLQDMERRRLAPEADEDPLHNPINYVLECIHTIYGIHRKDDGIHRVNMSIAATTVKNYRKLRDIGIGTHILFQETYHEESYEALHPTGPEHDYRYHTEAMDRAMEGGIDDVGIGVLFGLDKYRYEFAGLLMYAEHLEAVCGTGPHIIDMPHLKGADDIDPVEFNSGTDGEAFSRVTTCIRITVPYTGIIISTCESEAIRGKTLRAGISQISGGPRTSADGHTEEEGVHGAEQFDVLDQRTSDEVLLWPVWDSSLPSFCTACYRKGRTGNRFMSLCKSGQVQSYYRPNALMTLAEYLTDYASKETGEINKVLVKTGLTTIPNERNHTTAVENIEEIYVSSRWDFRS